MLRHCIARPLHPAVRQRIALSHGDALCTGDTEYQNFRSLVRSSAWQAEFLAKPLQERQAIAQSIRAQSESKKRSSADYADVGPQAATQLLDTLHANTLIHGHTHRPGAVSLADGRERLVLSDWVAQATPPRADIIRLRLDDNENLTVSRLSPDAIARAED